MIAGLQTVSAGGLVSDAILSDTHVYGSATGTFVSRGTQNVFGTATDTTSSGSTAFAPTGDQVVESGGIASGTIVDAGGGLSNLRGRSRRQRRGDSRRNRDGRERRPRQRDHGRSTSGYAVVEAGGSATDTLVLSLGELAVMAGGSASLTTLSGSSATEVFTGGRAAPRSMPADNSSSKPAD